MITKISYYDGQDINLIVDIGTPFAGVLDVEAVLWNDGQARKTLKKTEADPAKQIIPLDGEGNENKCRVRVFRSELDDWVDGYVHIGLSITVADDAFPDGLTDKYYGIIAKFNRLP